MLDEYKIIFKFSNGFKSYITSDNKLSGYINKIRNKLVAIEMAKSHMTEYNSCDNNTIKIIGYTIEYRQTTEWKECKNNLY